MTQLLQGGVFNLLMNLGSFLLSAIDYDARQVRDVDDGCDYDHKSDKHRDQGDLAGANSESGQGRAGGAPLCDVLYDPIFSELFSCCCRDSHTKNPLRRAEWREER